MPRNKSGKNGHGHSCDHVTSRSSAGYIIRCKYQNINKLYPFWPKIIIVILLFHFANPAYVGFYRTFCVSTSFIANTFRLNASIYSL